LDLTIENRRDMPKIIDHLFERYGIREIICEVAFHDREQPEFLGAHIMLGTDPRENSEDILLFQRIDYQFAHELTHAIQYHTERIEIKRYPYDHPVEAEARANAEYVMHELLGYTDYPTD